MANLGDRSAPISFQTRFRFALVLLRPAQKLMFFALVAGRILMGFCDLMLAAAMYVLFVLLQGVGLSRHGWWTPHSILSASLFTAIIVLLRILLDLGLSRSTIRFTQILYGDLLLRLVEGYGRMLWTHFVQRNRSEMLKHAITTAQDAAYSYQLLGEAASGTVVIAALAAALIYQSPSLAVCLAAITLPLYSLHRFGLRNRLNASAALRERTLRQLQKTIAETLSAGKEIRTYANESFFHNHIQKHASVIAENNVRLALLPQTTRVLAEQGAILLFLGILIFVELRHGDLRSLLSVLVFYFVLSRRLLPMLSSLTLTFGQLEGAYENLRTINEELWDCTRLRSTSPQPEPPSPSFVLNLRNLYFSYPDKTRILNGLSLDIKPGQITVLQGVSGVGKSSLLNIIAGVLPPDSGAVQVDRTSIAYVPQEIALLDESIRNNMLFGLPFVEDQTVMEALSVVNLRGLVASLPAGLDTRVGDDGVLFSGGQRQRLGLARAILRNVSLLLLDEATSALDEVNEREILRNLAGLHIAILLVTHRVQSTYFADRIYRLKDGALAELSSTAPASNDEPLSVA